MECRRAVGLFSAHLDKDHEFAEREQVDSHLRSCPSCKHEFKLYERAWQALDAFPRREPSSAFLPTVAEQIRRDRPSPIFFFRPAWALAVFLILAIVCVTLSFRLDRREAVVGAAPADILSISSPLEESDIAGSAFKIQLGGDIGEIRGVFSDESEEFMALWFE